MRKLAPFMLLTLLVGCAVPPTVDEADKSKSAVASTPQAQLEVAPPPGGESSVTTPGEGTPITFKTWSGTRKGSGSLKEGEVEESLEIAAITLSEAGKAEIKLTGSKLPETTFLGTWEKKDDKTVSLTITGGMGNAGTDAKGELKFMDAENPYELTFEGTVPRTKSPISVSFKMGG